MKAELQTTGNTILGLLTVMPKAFNVESKVFYQKMKANYHRYIAVSTTGDSMTEAANIAKMRTPRPRQCR